jgi:hypothetical protein
MKALIEKYYDSIDAWARTVPASEWKPGPPPAYSYGVFAVKTETGKILVGREKAFTPNACDRIAEMSKYGCVVAHLGAGQ